MQNNDTATHDARNSAPQTTPGSRRGGLLRAIGDTWRQSKWKVIAIVLAFSLSGSITVRISGPLLALILGDNPPRWLWWTLRILIIVPLYEMILVVCGTLLGQGKFFRSKLMKLLRRMAGPFARRAR